MFVRRTLAYHRNRFRFVIVVFVLLHADADVIAWLKIADRRLAACGRQVFGRSRNLHRGDGFVVLLDHDVLVADVAEDSYQQVVFVLAILLVGTIRASGGSSARPATGKANTRSAKDNLTETGKAGEQQSN